MLKNEINDSEDMSDIDKALSKTKDPREKMMIRKQYS